MELINGIITAGALRALIQNVKDDEPILLMLEDEVDGCGFNASSITFTPALEGQERLDAIEEENIYDHTLWIKG